MAALGALFLALEAEFLGVLQLMMMATEMEIMAIFMVIYMMDPGGLGKMEMAHQKRVAIAFGVIAGLTGVALAVLPAWAPIAALAPGPTLQIHALGIELMTRSILIFAPPRLPLLV